MTPATSCVQIAGVEHEVIPRIRFLEGTNEWNLRQCRITPYALLAPFICAAVLFVDRLSPLANPPNRLEPNHREDGKQWDYR